MMTMMTKPCKCYCSGSGHNFFVPHFNLGLSVRLLLLIVLLGFIGVAGHSGNFKTTTTNYEDIHQSTFIANQQLEFHTDKLLEQSNFSLPKPHHHQHQHHENNMNENDHSLHQKSKDKKTKNKQKKNNKPKVKGHDEDSSEMRYLGGHDLPEDHEFPGGHDFLQGHRSHHSEPLTMAHRLDEEFKESKSVPVVPIQLPPPNDTIHYHYTDDEDSDFFDFAQSSLKPSSSSSSKVSYHSNPSNSNNKTSNSRKPSLSRKTILIQFDTFKEDESSSNNKNKNTKNSLAILASTKSKSRSSQNSNDKNSSSNNKNNNNKDNSLIDMEVSSSETFAQRVYPETKFKTSQSKFSGSDPKIIYDESPFHLNQNSQSHDDLKQGNNYYMQKGNELSSSSTSRLDDDREFQQKTRPKVKQLLPRYDNIDDDDHHQKYDKDDKPLNEKSTMDESKHVEEVVEFESKKISKVPPKVPQKKNKKSSSSIKRVKEPVQKSSQNPFKIDRAIIPNSSHNTTNSLEDLEDDFDYKSPDEDDQEDSGEEGRSSLRGRRPRRSVVHLYDMVVCATGCNPLAYKGYGCYCGFLGSGLTVDGIDRCCAKHDWCYHHAKCPPLLTYFVPYYWTCNAGRPKCVTDYRGWKGVCGANLCECDRQFAECLRKFPCPRSRAMCMTSPWRNLPIGPNNVFVA